jgi:hypothetical protein
MQFERDSICHQIVQQGKAILRRLHFNARVKRPVDKFKSPDSPVCNLILYPRENIQYYNVLEKNGVNCSSIGLTSSGLAYAAPNNFDEIIVFLGLSMIVLSTIASKFSNDGIFSDPSLTVSDLSGGSFPRLLTAVTYAFRFKSAKDNLSLAEGVQS